MSILFKAIALKLVAGRTVGGVFTLLVMLLAPIAGVLKFIGLPILLVLGVVGAPLFLVLGAIGLPAMFVLAIGGGILLLVGGIAAIGILAIKIVLPIVLIVWFVRWLRKPRVHSGPVPAAASAETL